MCGIAGWFDPEPKTEEILLKMTDTLISRGPDDFGLFCKGPIAFGHRRLAIIDLAASLQPMIYEQYVLTYNGEIYNFKEIRKELISLGHEFKTTGDTEVVLHALMQWKEGALEKFEGMFALAFWDGEALLLARDHFGVKPLYICHLGEKLLFASEIKALLEHPLVSREIDPNALGLYLECQYIPAPFSIYKAIKKLPAAHYLRFKNGQIEQKRYWNPAYVPKFSFDEQSAMCELDAHLRRSVRSMLVADVPLGAFVSGGIDSSLIAALMQEESGEKVNIFTIALDHPHSEHQHAASVAKHLGAHFHPFFVQPTDLIGALDQIFCEPFGDQAALPTLLLSKFARESVKVVLSGEGADEILAGYSNYPKRLKEWPICNRWSPFYSPIHRWMPQKLRKNRLFKAMAREPSRRYMTIPNLFDSEIHSSLLTKDFRRAQTLSLEEVAESHYLTCDSFEYLDKMLHIDTNLWLADDLLTKVDRATMAYSLEARVPYLDHRLVEFAAKLPSDLKLQGSQGKYLLKKIATRYLPEHIVFRPKWGFVMPLHTWMAKELKPHVSDALNSLMKRNIFKMGLSKRKDLHATRLYALLSLELWFRRHSPDYRF